MLRSFTLSNRFKLYDGREVVLKENHNVFNFKCQEGCNLCCMDHDIRLSPFDILRLCVKLKIKTNEFLEKYTSFIYDKQFNGTASCMLNLKNGCRFLKEGICSIYDARPFLCRMYPVGTLFDDKKTLYYLYEKSCPGLKSGKKWRIDEYCKKSLDKGDEEYYKRWIEFRVMFHDLDFPKNDKDYFAKFISICYNFDSPLFKEYLKKFSLQTINKIDAIFKIAEIVLLGSYKKNGSYSYEVKIR